MKLSFNLNIKICLKLMLWRTEVAQIIIGIMCIFHVGTGLDSLTGSNCVSCPNVSALIWFLWLDTFSVVTALVRFFFLILEGFSNYLFTIDSISNTKYMIKLQQKVYADISLTIQCC